MRQSSKIYKKNDIEQKQMIKDKKENKNKRYKIKTIQNKNRMI